MTASSIRHPIVTFGVLTDVQYADCEDRPAGYDASKTRFYRRSLSQVDTAFTHWKSSTDVKFVLQLGDIIDGLCRYHGGSYQCLKNTLEHFEKNSSIPTFHTVGNHELYNFNRKELVTLFYKSVMKLQIPSEIFCPLEPVANNSSLSTPVLYYKFSPVPKIKCISLDCFDISVLGYDEQHPKYKEAANILEDKHGHANFDEWDSNGPLEGLDVRFQQMNGAIGKEQMQWLDKELAESDDLEQKVIIFGHVSISPDSTDPSCILWNFDEIMNIFHQHHCVIAYFSGHSHSNGFAIDSHGISYVVFTGIIETPPNSSSFATVSIYEDFLKITGYGIEKSHTITLKSDLDLGINSEDELENEAVSPATVKVKV